MIIFYRTYKMVLYISEILNTFIMEVCVFKSLYELHFWFVLAFIN